MKKITSFSKLTVKIPIKIISIMLIIMTFLSVSVVSMSRTATTNSIEREVDYLAQMNAAKVSSYLENMYMLSQSMAKEIQRYGKFGRSIAEPILIESLNSALDNDKIFGAYFAFEPGLFFPGTPKGLSYYAYRNGNEVAVDILTDYDVYSTADYYIGAHDSMATYVTEPYSYELTNGETVWLITLSTPLINDNGEFVGVANCDILADSINSIAFDNGGYQTAYSTVLSQQGMYIADSFDKSKQGSYFDGKEKQKILDTIQTGSKVTMEGENTYFGNEKAVVTYIPITLNGTNLHWASGFVISKREAFSGASWMTVFIVLTCIISIVLLSIFTHSIIKRSLSPISYVMGLADKMRRCDLSEIQSDSDMQLPDDELGLLANIFTEVSAELTSIIKDINYCLNNMAAGNFCIESQCEEQYIGDYSYILRDMKKIREKLSNTLMHIEESSRQVQDGSEQIAQGAQTLAQGSSEQAASVEELAATLANLSTRIKHTAADAGFANKIAKETGLGITESNQQMQELLAAMEEIKASSVEIGKIINTIDTIAFQTNILALNAAVEAARAGTAGKGFAVVADEVRNLASKSAEAAKNTTTLIQNSVTAVENGSKLANTTADSLEKVVEKVHDIENKFTSIAAASEEQADSVTQITQGIDQISSVVQANSATAEESAAASEELSGQASFLKSLMAQFTLRS